VVLLTDKVAVLTGGGRGIGRASACLLAEQGARVVIGDLGCSSDGTGRDAAIAEAVAAEIRAQGSEAIALATDVSTPSGAEGLAEATRVAFGRIDVWVNSAGITRPEGLLEVTEASWRAVLGAVLDATFFCIQAAGRAMKKTGGGRIVNLTGFEGLVGGVRQAASAAALAGVYGLTRASSVELERDGILVNAIAPLSRVPGPSRDAESAHADLFTPEHVAPVVLLLASDLLGPESGLVVGVAGTRISVFRMVESQGLAKQGRGIWSPDEIVEHWPSIAKFRT
jgi:NAD(P)-dependent dehydrogenase (short-subunit alcohol dehydrogenase family)